MYVHACIDTLKQKRDQKLKTWHSSSL